eukprot:4663265-Pyramimonas_sp.AAC.1
MNVLGRFATRFAGPLWLLSVQCRYAPPGRTITHSHASCAVCFPCAMDVGVTASPIRIARLRGSLPSWRALP